MNKWICNVYINITDPIYLNKLWGHRGSNGTLCWPGTTNPCAAAFWNMEDVWHVWIHTGLGVHWVFASKRPCAILMNEQIFQSLVLGTTNCKPGLPHVYSDWNPITCIRSGQRWPFLHVPLSCLYTEVFICLTFVCLLSRQFTQTGSFGSSIHK